MSQAPLLSLYVLGLPFAAFALLGVVAPLRRSGRLAGVISILAVFGSFLGASRLFLLIRQMPEPVEVSVSWIPGATGPLAVVGLLLDPVSGVMLLLVSLVALLVQLYSLGYLSDEPPAALGRYYTYHSLFAFSMLGLVAANNFLQMFLSWELVGLCSYLLIGFWYRKPEAARAAVKAFWVTKLGDLGFLIGIVLLWGKTNRFDFTGLFALVKENRIDLGFLALVTFLIYLGAVGKSAQFPLHVWLPDAMEGPTPVSALIHAATMVAAGVYMVTRVYPLFLAAPTTLTIIAWVGAFTALLAASLALVQEDIKRVLAYSTISQLGYMMAALGSGAMVAGYFHLFTHGFFKALLFLGAGAVIHAIGTNDIFQMGKLARAMPVTAVVFIIGSLALAGIWPFSGFFSKEEVLAGVWAAGLKTPFLMLAGTVFLTAFYMFRVIVVTFFGRQGGHAHGDGGAAHAHPHDPPLVMALPLWILAVLSIAAGAYGKEFTRLIGHVAEEHPIPAFLTPMSLALAGAGIVAAWLVYQAEIVRAQTLARLLRPLHTAASRKYWMDDLYGWGYGKVLLGLSWVVGFIDRYFVDGLVNVLSAGTMQAGQSLRQIQSGRAQDYLYGVVAGLVLLLVWGYLTF